MPPMPRTHPTRFCIVRHGETDWNSERRIQGQIDIDLNAAGETQARALGPGLSGHSFAAVYSSDLLRAWNTARIATAGLGLAVSPAPTLRERHFGVLQGLTRDEARQRYPEIYLEHQARSLHSDYRGGETLAGFARRVTDGLAEMALRDAGQTVLAFTHGGVLDIVYRVATGRALEAPRNFLLPNAAVNWLEHSDGHWRLISWGDCGHLEGALDGALE
ncbi:MAG: histidine phosphatase family protein [Sulfuritalea sp.]|nr:histidine phosphatase family protein [Sulfuritalea sp.]MBK8119902.1 histidine phosphatase family protein [Sulfuritalea sp.]